MPDDRELARSALRLQEEGKDYPMMKVPGYAAWAQRKLDEGESPALIAHLDATSMFLLPEELGSVGEEAFEELLQDLREEVEENDR